MLKIDHPLMWSYAGPWYWEIQQLGAPTGTLEGRMRASAACGFNCLPLSVQTLNDMNDVDLDKLFDLMQELNLTFHPALHLPFLNSTIDEMKVFAENWENSIPKFKKFFGGNMTSSGLGAGHRFKRDMTVSEKFKKLSPTLLLSLKSVRTQIILWPLKITATSIALNLPRFAIPPRTSIFSLILETLI